MIKDQGHTQEFLCDLQTFTNNFCIHACYFLCQINSFTYSSQLTDSNSIVFQLFLFQMFSAILLRYLHTSIDDAALMDPEGIGTAKCCPTVCAGDSMKYVESKYWYHSVILPIIPIIYCSFINIYKFDRIKVFDV